MSNDCLLSDLEFAKRLDRVINGPDNISESENMDDSIIFVSEEFSNVKSEQKHEIIEPKRIKDSEDEYFLSEFSTYIDINNSSEWKLCKMFNNIQMIFDRLKEHFFGILLNGMKMKITWDVNRVLSDELMFKIFENKEIIIAQSLVTRPRIQLISTVLHILIHLYLNYDSKGAIKLSDHSEDFRKIMQFFNSKLNTTISTWHKIIHCSEESSYKKQWWQCSGICCNYDPFYGIIRSTIVPNETLAFWSMHHDKCQGSFFKLFEAERVNENGDIDKKYVRSSCYMNPIPSTSSNQAPTILINSSAANHKHLKIKLQVREEVDLTDDEPVVKNMCDVVNLDESMFNALDDKPDNNNCNTIYWKKFDEFNWKECLTICPFCRKAIGALRMISHADFCLGYQQQIVFKLKK